MISKMGWCELNCTLCSQVCPTGAIREISIVEKLGIGPFESKGPVKTGTAFYNQGRCCPGRWIPVAWSAKKFARSAPKPSSPVTWRSPTAGERPSS